jgi:hypothetical protein
MHELKLTLMKEKDAPIRQIQRHIDPKIQPEQIKA